MNKCHYLKLREEFHLLSTLMKIWLSEWQKSQKQESVFFLSMAIRNWLKEAIFLLRNPSPTMIRTMEINFLIMTLIAKIALITMTLFFNFINRPPERILTTSVSVFLINNNPLPTLLTLRNILKMTNSNSKRSTRARYRV